MIMNTAIEYQPEIQRPSVGLGFSHQLADKVLSRTNHSVPAWPEVTPYSKATSSIKEWDKSSILFKEERIMDFQRAFSPSKSMVMCGLSTIPNQNPTLKAYKNSQGNYFTGFAGLNTCDNHLCLCCNKKASVQRRRDTQNALFAVQKEGKVAKFLTFTLPKVGMSRERINALNKAYNYIVSNSLKRYTRRRGVKEYQHTRSIDLTIDETNTRQPFHFHIHAIILMDKDVSGLKEYIWDAYKRIMNMIGYAPTKSGFDLQDVENSKGIEDYLNKSFHSLSFETTSSFKDGKNKNSVGVLKWLLKAAEEPTRRRIGIYKALIKETKRVRWWSCSRGFKEMGQDIKNKVEEQVTEVFSQEIGRNLWYSINSLSGARAKIQELLISRLENPDNLNQEWKELHVLIAGSLYESEISPRLIEMYRIELKRILNL
jgi:hypothetical protein